MKTIHLVIAELIKKRGKTDKEVAKKLSELSEKPISSQRLGLYANGKRTPGADFILLWEEVYGDKILDIVREKETKVSRVTNNKQNGTSVDLKKNLPYNEEREILIRNIDRIGETNEYLLKRIKELGG